MIDLLWINRETPKLNGSLEQTSFLILDPQLQTPQLYYAIEVGRFVMIYPRNIYNFNHEEIGKYILNRAFGGGWMGERR